MKTTNHVQSVGDLQCGCRAMVKRNENALWSGWIEPGGECTSQHGFLKNLMYAWIRQRNERTLRERRRAR